MRKSSLAALLFFLSGCSSPFGEAKEAVRKDMKDPNSTEFRNLSFCGEDGRSIIRGEYNSKSSYGAYEGFKSFHYDAGITDVSDEFSRLTRRCSEQARREADEKTAGNAALKKLYPN